MRNNSNRNRRFDKRVKPSRDFGRSRDSVEIDMAKVKHVNEDAISRSKQHNKIVDSLNFSSPSGRYITLGGNQLMYFTLMPTKPLIDCRYVKLLETVETVEKLEKVDRIETIERIYTVDVKNKDKRKPGMVEKKEIVKVVEKLKDTDSIVKKNNVAYIRGCIFGKKDGEIPGICSLSNEKILNKVCFGNKFQGSSVEFIIVTKGFIQIDGEGKDFKVAFLNKNNSFTKEELRDNTDPLKNNCLWELYNAIKAGNVKTWTIPKPGNTLFHTMFSGDVEVDIETISGDILTGIVKGYEFTPGGHPSLNLVMKDEHGEKIRVLPLYMVSIMIVYKYKTDNILSKRAIELTLNGHVVIPHRGNNTIYDYCKRRRTEREQEIKLDGTVIPYDQLDEHDIEVKNIIKN